jgi:hypothetical protein
MRRLWFAPLPSLHWGKPGALTFHRHRDEVAAFAAPSANLVKDENGLSLSIDLLLLRADAARPTALAASRR